MIVQSRQKLTLIITILLSVTLLLSGVLRVLAGTGQKVAATNVGGVLLADTTWTLANSPYVVTETVRIPSGISLTIEAGVTIKYDSSVYADFAALDVEEGGHLEAVGTAVNPIIFTSLQDSAPGEWIGIVIVGSANLQHTQFRYGELNVDIWGASDEPVVIQDSLFSDSGDVGMRIALEALHRVQLSNLEFANNVQNRIHIIRYSEAEQLIDDVILKPMVGLDGYWFEPDNAISPLFIVPDGMTLTMQAGTTLMMSQVSLLDVQGHLIATGDVNNHVRIMGHSETVPSDERWVGIAFNEMASSGSMAYTEIRHANIAVGVFGATGDDVDISNSKIADGGVAILTTPSALHRLQMDNVAFENNEKNRVVLEGSDATNSFSQDAELTMQPGLEGYEFDMEELTNLNVPQGITLTMQAGSALLMPHFGTLIVEGHLWADGEVDHSVYFTRTTEMVSNDEQWTGLVFGEAGSGLMTFTEIHHADVGVGVFGANGGTVAISDSKIANGSIGVVSTPSSLHRLLMDNVVFENNERNRIALEIVEGVEAFSQDVTLMAQPGLEGYEIFNKYDQIVIPEGVRLTIGPDATLFMTETMGLQVAGHLQLQGTVGHTATLTSFGEGLWWKGVEVLNNGLLTIEYGEILWAETAVSIISPTATLSATRSALMQNEVGIEATNGVLSMTYTAVTHNNTGIHIGMGANPDTYIRQNNISGNVGAGAVNESDVPIDVRFNWWGDADGPSGNGSGSGDSVLGNLVFDQWLDEYEGMPSYLIFLPFVIRP